MDPILRRFKNFVVSNDLIQPKDKILLSLSAGKDSMFMLALLLEITSEFNLNLGIFHLNHLMRGNESDEDERFVIETAKKYGIPFFIERFDFKNNRTNFSFEEHAREIRYSLLRKISSGEDYRKIATAHNMNDNAETLLMRILSGTGIAGLKGISAAMNNVIRPVLFAERSEIYDYLEKNGIKWREDASNNDEIYLRNFVRNSVIPSLNERFPNSEKNLVNLANHASENLDILYRFADSIYPETIIYSQDETIIRIEGFINDVPVIKLFLGRVLAEFHGVKIKISIYNEIIKRLLINSSNMMLYENDSIIIRKKLIDGKQVISISSIKEKYVNNSEWEYVLTPGNNSQVRIDEIKKDVAVVLADYGYYIEHKGLPEVVFIQGDDEIQLYKIRNRRSGDRIAIENGTKKIKEIMIEKKLDTETKNRVPLITADGQVAAYLPGLVISDNNRVSCNFHIRDDTKRILAFFFRDY